MGKQHLRLETLTINRTRIYKVEIHSENTLVQENCNTDSMQRASPRLSQPSAEPSFLGQDPPHQCQTGQ